MSTESKVRLDRIRRAYKGKVYESVLLRRSYRLNGKVHHENLGSLTHFPPHIVELIRASIQTGTPAPSLSTPLPSTQIPNPTSVAPQSAVYCPNLQVTSTLPHGHVQALWNMVRKIDLPSLLHRRTTKQRSLVLAMIIQRLLAPRSKLASSRCFAQTTLASVLGIKCPSKDTLYRALDWLLEQQTMIQNRLARLYLADEQAVFYDLSSSYFEGRQCSLAKRGYDRDGKKGCPLVVYGVIASSQGCPVAISVFPGNTADSATVTDQLDLITQKFGLKNLLMVSDRGVLAGPQIELLKARGMTWVSALRSKSVGKLLADKTISREQLEKETLVEVSSKQYPNERLVACFNSELAKERGRKRQELLKATMDELKTVQESVAKTRPKTQVEGENGQENSATTCEEKAEKASGQELPKAKRAKRSKEDYEIWIRIGEILNKYKMKKHIKCELSEKGLELSRKEEKIQAEEKLDGIYVLRTNVKVEKLSAADVVRTYKKLIRVEMVFRAMKGMDIKIRPIFHRKEERVKSHLFLCMLACHLEWHMREAWRSMLFEEEELEKKRATRDAVKAAKPSKEVTQKKGRRQSGDGLAVHSFETLLKELELQSRNRLEIEVEGQKQSFEKDTMLNEIQRKALDAIEKYQVR